MQILVDSSTKLGSKIDPTGIILQNTIIRQIKANQPNYTH